MSGSFNDIDVPPTLVSFAVAPGDTQLALSPEFKQTGSNIYFLQIERDDQHIPNFEVLKEVAQMLHSENEAGNILSIHSLAEGGITAGIAKMAFGNMVGAKLETELDLYQERYISFLIETPNRLPDGLSSFWSNHYWPNHR